MKKLICLLLSISVAFFALTAGCGGEESPAHEHEFELGRLLLPLRHAR